MKNYIEALKEIKKESKDFKITLSRKEVLEITKEFDRLNNIINRTTKYVESLISKGRGCDIYEDIKQEILKELKGVDKE